MKRYARKGQLLLFLFLFLSPLAEAAVSSTDLTIDVMVGFRGVFKLEHWTPLLITVENRGPGRRGTLQWTVYGGREYLGENIVTTYRRPVDLPHNSRKRFKTITMISSYNTPMLFRFIEKGGRVVAEKKVTLPPHPPLEKLLLGLSQGFPLDFFTVVPERRTQVVYPRLEDLPDQVYGYDSVDAIVVHQVPLRSLTPAQMQALQQWVALGGRLIFSSGAHYSLYQDPRLASLLPVKIQGLVELHSLHSLEKLYGAPIPTPRPFVVTRVLPQRGTVRIQEGEVPLVVERQIGRGKVIFLTFDFSRYPFQTWEKRLLFWKDLVQDEASSEVEWLYQRLQNRWENELVDMILRLPLLDFPSHLLLFLFLCTYLFALGFLLWQLGEGRWPRKQLWIGMSGVLIFFTLSALWVLREEHLDQDAVLFQIATVENLPQSDFAVVESRIALFSTVQKPYDVTIWGKGISLSLGTGSEEAKGTKRFEITEGEGYTKITNLPLDRWGLRTFRARAVLPFPVQVAVQQEAEMIRLRLTNRTGHALSHNWLWYRGTLFPLGDWQPQTSITYEFSSPLRVENEQFLFDRWQRDVATRVGGDQEDAIHHIRRALVEKVFPQGQNRESPAPDRFLVLGWLEGGVPRVTVEGAGTRYEQATLVKLSFPGTQPSLSRD